MTEPTLSREQVLALVLSKQHLGAGAAGGSVLEVADDLLGLHATVAASPYLQLRARLRAFAPQQLDTLLDAGRAAKVACMRRTLFIESAELIPLVLAATRALAARSRERYLAANGLTPHDYERVAKRVEAELSGRALDAHGLRDALGAGEPLSPVLVVMCDEGRLVRWKGKGARPAYRRFGEALPGVRLDTWDERSAVRELVDRYVHRYGPVSERDVAWWTGLRKTAVRDALAQLARVRVEGFRSVLFAHEDDLQRPAAPAAGQLALLGVLDPYLQGYRDRAWCADPRHRRYIVDASGNATSVILVDGRVAGVWDFAAELRLLFFDRPGADTRRRAHGLAAEVAAFLTDRQARVVEVDRMAALTDRSAGRFLSPLADP